MRRKFEISESFSREIELFLKVLNIWFAVSEKL